MTGRLVTTEGFGGFPESSFRYGPLRHARNVFVSFVKGLFKAAPPGAYHWSDDDTLSEIFITGESTVDASTVGQRPVVTFVRGPIRLFGTGHGDTESVDPRDGTEQKSALIPGTMSINCSSRVDLESEQIAWNIFEYIWLLRHLLIGKGFFDIGRPEMGAPTKSGEVVLEDQGKEWWTTAVLVPWHLERTSKFTPLGQQVLQNIITELQSTFSPVVFPDPPQGLQATELYPPPFAPDASDVRGSAPSPGDPPRPVRLAPHPLNPAKTVVVTEVGRPRSRGR